MKLTKLVVLSAAILVGTAFADVSTHQGLASDAYLLAQNDVRLPARDRVDPGRDVRNDAAPKRANDQASGKGPDPVVKSGVQQCPGEFALCASSTCKPTGKTIKVNI